jgi:biotin carboxylase
VLGIADEPRDRLSAELQSALTEYSQVASLEDYDAVYRAAAYLVSRHGRIDRVESLAEHWMRMEARLREDFRVAGRSLADLEQLQRKSVMKQRFVDAGVPAARGRLLGAREEAEAFLRETGYPAVAKPDVGVGAVGTYRLDGPADLDRLYREKGDREYFLEAFVDGAIVTYDGLVDGAGRVVFAGSLEYSIGVMEAVNQERDLYYFTHRSIPGELEELGRRAVRAFEVRDGFFHFEFFRLRDGCYVALEANLRPPGAWSVDMFNYGSEVDLYAEWANVVARRESRLPAEPSWYCCYAGRKNTLRHRLPHEEVLRLFGGRIVHHIPVPPLFRGGMGDYAYLFRTADLEEMHAIARAIHETA